MGKTGIVFLVLTSNHGGWAFNIFPHDEAIHTIIPGVGWEMKRPSEIPTPHPPAFLIHLATNPFFNMSGHPVLADPQTGRDSPGSRYAEAHRNAIIAEMIPCTTFSAGRNALNALGNDMNHPLDPGRNVDMNTTMKTDPNEWPLTDEVKEHDNDPPLRAWLHSDIRIKAFTHNWKAYEKFVEIGELK